MGDISETIASAFGFALQQSYALREGEWWLLTAGKPMRTLKADEVAWHVARNHAPFVDGGITPDSPDWWKDPVEKAGGDDE